MCAAIPTLTSAPMTTNPYQSPETESNLPKRSVNWLRYTVRLVVVVAILGMLVAVLLPAGALGSERPLGGYSAAII